MIKTTRYFTQFATVQHSSHFQKTYLDHIAKFITLEKHIQILSFPNELPENSRCEST